LAALEKYRSLLRGGSGNAGHATRRRSSVLRLERFLRTLRSHWTSGCLRCGCSATARTALAATKFIVQPALVRNLRGSCFSGFGLLCRITARAECPAVKSRLTKLSSAGRLAICIRTCERVELPEPDRK